MIVSVTSVYKANAAGLAAYLIFALLFGLIVLFPTQLQLAKGVVLTLFVIARLAHLSSVGRLKFDDSNLTVPIFFSAVGLAYCAYGAILGAPGASSVVPVHAVYPLLFGFLAGTANLSEAKRLIEWTFALSRIGTLLIALLFAWYVTGHEGVPLFEEAIADVSNDAGYTKLSFPLLSLLNFSVPFLIANYVFHAGGRRRMVDLVLLILTVVAAIVTGRRATWIVLLIGLVLPTFFHGVTIKGALALVGIALIGGSLAFWTGGLDWNVLVSHMIAGFQFSSLADSGSALERGLQFDALMRGFYERPVFGHGLGSTAASFGSLRSLDLPWAYELTYIYYLFAVGFVGFLVYGAGIIALVLGLHRMTRRPDCRPYAVPLLAGLVGFVIANATNPYLAKFDYMFVLFIPYALIVADARERRSTLV